MMPVIPLVVENIPNPAVSGASAQAGVKGSFESWMAEFSNLCAAQGLSEDTILPGLILKGAGRQNALSPEELNIFLSIEDPDSLVEGDEADYAAFLNSFPWWEAVKATPESTNEEPAQGKLPKAYELPSFTGREVAVALKEAAQLTDVAIQEVQAKNDSAGISVVAQKLSENPHIPVAINHAEASDKALQTAPVFDEALLTEEGSASRQKPVVELYKTLDETPPGKNPEQVREVLDRRSQSGKERVDIPLTSSVADEPAADFAEELPSRLVLESSETGSADVAKSTAGQAHSRTDGPAANVNLDGVSAALGADPRTEAVGKEFVNVREGVEYVRLPSGEMIDKQAVLDQVIQHVSLRNAAEGKTLTIRMHPQELGELKLDLILEHDKVRVNIQTQTHMVQDVLEQHLPRLREALEAQGVRVGEMQLSLDSQQQSPESFRHFNFGQDAAQQGFRFSRQGGESQGQESFERPSPEHLAGTRNSDGTGLSLRI